MDECTSLPNGLCQQICINTFGSYFCECREGFRAVGQFLCEGTIHLCTHYRTMGVYNHCVFHTDINECEEQIDSCSKLGPAPANCINGIGDYRCSCANYRGYRLASDNSSCVGKQMCTSTCNTSMPEYENTLMAYH